MVGRSKGWRSYTYKCLDCQAEKEITYIRDIRLHYKQYRKGNFTLSFSAQHKSYIYSAHKLLEIFWANHRYCEQSSLGFHVRAFDLRESEQRKYVAHSSIPGRHSKSYPHISLQYDFNEYISCNFVFKRLVHNRRKYIKPTLNIRTRQFNFCSTQ